MTTPIKDFSLKELEALMRNARLPVFRAEQILVWIYGKGATSYSQMTNVPRVIREQFETSFPLYETCVTTKRESIDGSRKYLIEFHDGTTVEAVALPSSDGRLSVCCSSQAGCAMSCSFCATGKAGFERNLSVGEIVDQVLLVQDDFGKKATNVVIMGQGEPFANYEAVMGALRVMNHGKMLNIGSRHITVSTCGLIKGIERFTEEPEQFTLAVSLHSAQQGVRDELLPAMRNERLGTLRQALDRYASATGRRFSFEYALMRGVNDSDDALDALITYCKRLLCHVNLIPLNEVSGSPFQPVSPDMMRRWRDELEKAGIPASVRRSRGADIDGACGQLKNIANQSSWKEASKLREI